MKDRTFREQRGDYIIGLRRAMDVLDDAVQAMGRSFVPGYHFLDHKISTFWRCPDSPIGMCVFKLTERGHCADCIYCHNPVERK